MNASIVTVLVTALVFTVAITQRISIFKILKRRGDYQVEYMDEFYK